MLPTTLLRKHKAEYKSYDVTKRRSHHLKKKDWECRKESDMTSFQSSVGLFPIWSWAVIVGFDPDDMASSTIDTNTYKNTKKNKTKYDYKSCLWLSVAVLVLIQMAWRSTGCGENALLPDQKNITNHQYKYKQRCKNIYTQIQIQIQIKTRRIFYKYRNFIRLG